MYNLDINTNTAIERQADRMNAVQAYGSGKSAASWTDGNQRQPTAKLTVALAAATPIVALLAWMLVAR